MDRRDFICKVSGAGAAATTLAASGAAAHSSAVVYKVDGFTCVTCAVGLEVMLRGLKGVMRASASYPEKKVSIAFDADMISEKSLRDFIAGCGFSAS